MKLAAAIVILFGCSYGTAIAQPGVMWEYEELRTYLGDLQASRTGVFFSECKVTDDKSNSKLVMLLPIGSTKGRFVDMVDTPTLAGHTVKNPVNWADMSWKNGKWHYYI